MNEELLDQEEYVDEAEAEEQRRFAEATDDEGNFKTLGHRMAYYEETPSLPPGAPSPYSYKDEDEDQWEQDVREFKEHARTKAAVRDGVREAMSPKQPAVPLPDDEYRPQRQKLMQQIEDFELKAERARRRRERRPGYTEADERQRAEQYRRQLEALPQSRGQTVLENAKVGHYNLSVSHLFDHRYADDPKWDTPRWQNDSAIALAERNRMAKEGDVIALPIEDSPWGTPLSVRPRNMCTIGLPKDQMAAFKQYVYSAGDETPDTLWRRSWAWLHTHGYANSAERAFPSEEPAAKGEKKAEPEKEKSFPYEIRVRPGMFPK